ncbi:YetF domain-containing protein [Alkaliphilus sp. B6464]|uniref:YetF domain-containing protein n=1 Tax=Alkaliphilus sp. B6464 TaxID=2731219 RepID=UPI001BA4D1A9|nr:DUF421 domain-containing protein [Alkaliphilus sp. B6464]QUH18914.1 DUF421 domain-containing protein [Alkaliphilus sp. B6464]
MFVVFVRAILLYSLVVVVIRMMGKRQVAEMQPFELVIMIMIAELAATPMEDVGIPLINGVIPIIALLSMQVLISYFSLKSEKFREIICGKPSILIHKGRIDQSELRRQRVNMNDLLEALRNKDYFNISDIDYAILETNGQMSILPKADKRPVITSDLYSYDHIQYEELPVTLIVDGKLNDTKLRKAGYDENWLMNQLGKQNIDNIENVFFAFLSSDKIFYAQEKQN